MNAIIPATLFVLLCGMTGLFMPTCEAGTVQDFEAKIEKFLAGEKGFKEDLKYMKCVAKGIKETDLFDRITSGRNFAEEIGAIKDEVKFICDVERFFRTPIGIVVAVLLVIVAIAIVCKCLDSLFC